MHIYDVIMYIYNILKVKITQTLQQCWLVKYKSLIGVVYTFIIYSPNC
jgi:hypothetical protein